MKKIILIFLLLIYNITISQKAVYPFSENEKWGIIDSDRNIILEPILTDKISFFYNYQSKFPVSKFRRNNKYGLINRKGKEILPPVYDRIFSTEHHPEIMYIKNNQEIHLYNSKIEKIVIKGIKDNGNFKFYFIDKNIIIIDKENKIEKKYTFSGKYISEKSYSTSKYEEDNFMPFGIEDWHIDNKSKDEETFKKNIANIDPEIKIIKIYRDPFFYALAEKKNVMGLLNYEGDFMLPFEYANLFTTNRLYIHIEKNYKFGLYSLKQKKVILSPEYSYLRNATATYSRDFREALVYCPIGLFNYAIIRTEKFKGYANIKTGEVYLPE